MTWPRASAILLACALALSSACVSNPQPATPGASRFPDFAEPTVPASLASQTAVVDAHWRAWQRLQGGDVNGAGRDFASLLKRAPSFYPALTGLGDVALAQKQYKSAAGQFAAVLQMDAAYLPALTGLVDAQLGDGDRARAVATLETIVRLDPSRESAKTRLDVLRLRAVEQEMTTAAAARSAGRLDEAHAAYVRALALAPSSPLVLRELAAVEAAQGALDDAEAHIHAALSFDPSDPEAYVTLGAVLEARGRFREAGDAFDRAVALDPRPAWRARAEALRARADLDALPKEYRDIPAATSVTRGQVAAYLALKLKDLVDRAPRQAPAVITDIGAHWAAPWILSVTRAGLMEIQTNHTFQPNALVHRTDLARVVSQVLALVAARHAKEAAAWRSARPKFADLAPDHAAYAAVAAAVAAGVMAPDGDRFSPTRLVTGPELVAAVARLGQLASD